MFSEMTDATAVHRVQRAGSPYEVLGLTREASADEVKRAYRALSLKVHPDRNQEPGATAAFKAVGAAYAVLSDAKERLAFDRAHEMGADASGNVNGKAAKVPPKTAAERAAEAELDAELEAMLTRSAYRDWVAKARSEQQTLVRTIMGAALFVGLGVLALLISHALPSSGSSAGRDDGTAWYTLMWLGTFIGRIALGLILLVLLVLIGPVALAMSVAGLGKLCGWFFDLCELLFSRVLTPLLEDYVLKPRVATTRSHPAQGGNVRRRRGHR